jgi:hypothetical protein
MLGTACHVVPIFVPYMYPLLSCSSALPSAREKSVFAYPKQRATVFVGSVLKWRARPQCLHRQKSVFPYPKQRATVSVGSVLKWRARPQCLRRRRDFVLQMNNTYVPTSTKNVCGGHKNLKFSKKAKKSKKLPKKQKFVKKAKICQKSQIFPKNTNFSKKYKFFQKRPYLQTPRPTWPPWSVSYC